LFAGEKLRSEDEHPCPELDVSERAAEFATCPGAYAAHVLNRVHLLDMIYERLIEATWPARLLPPLAERLQTLLDNPNG
jgi:hypothetical protein